MRSTLWVVLAAFQAVCAACQTSPPAGTRADLPPSAVLSEELSNFDRIRSDMANWSDIELAAFQATTAKAKSDCSRIQLTPHEGEEALALARICALGWNWDGTYSAARWYTRKSAPPEEAQHLVTGFALLLKADLSLQAVSRALDDLREMQERVPYSNDTDSIFAYTLNALEVMRPNDAVAAAMLRQPMLMNAIVGDEGDLSRGRAEAEAWHTLTVLQSAGRKDEEREQAAQLLQAIARRKVPLSVADQFVAQRGRQAYEWLGRDMPAFKVQQDTYPVSNRRTTIAGKAKLLVIQQADAADVPALSLAVDSLRAHVAPGTQASLVLSGLSSSVAVKRRANAPVAHAIYTGEDLLTVFAAELGPLFMVVDAANHIVWRGSGTAAWLNPQQQAEILLERASAQ